jgi:hypothetical protein
VDSAGNAYITGIARGTVGGAYMGQEDAYVIKFAPDGSEVWSRQLGTTESDIPAGITVDASENVYLTGHTRGSLGGAHVGNHDLFLAKLDSSGNTTWTEQFGLVQTDISFGVAVDSDGMIYIGGNSAGRYDGDYTLGRSDVLIAQYDANGNFNWVQHLDADISQGADLIMGIDGLPYLAGGGGDGGFPELYGTDSAQITKLGPIVVPEPATMGLVVAGGLALLSRRKK